MRREFQETMNQERFRQPLLDALTRASVNGSDLGIAVATEQLENIGLGFDWDAVNESARDWAIDHADEVARGIGATTQRQVQQSLVRWIDNGEPRQALIDDLSRYFERDRAERIATTEITRAFAEGNKLSYQSTGVIRQMEWWTADDERVCPICGPLHGKKLGFDQDWRGFLPDEVRETTRQAFTLPPAHPRCRCLVLPVVTRG
jgi:SPP1 gp7 family putative phage head morphogenesis protein